MKDTSRPEEVFGIHGAAITEYDWPWYGQLMGAFFAHHPNNPNVRKGAVDIGGKSTPLRKACRTDGSVWMNDPKDDPRYSGHLAMLYSLKEKGVRFESHESAGGHE